MRGTIYLMIGRITGNRRLQAKGRAYQLADTPLEGYGDLQEEVSDARRRTKL